MHAALCIPSVTGAWLHEGGGGFHNNGAIYHWNKSLIEGLDVADPRVRVLDQSRIGPVLTGDPDDLKGGPPVTALFIQNMNPVQVAPEQRKVKAGFAREDLFVVRARAVHDGDGARWPTWCCRPPCSWSTTTSTRAAATSTSCSARS